MVTGPWDPHAAAIGRLRASDADRDRVVDALETAYAQGLLTTDELAARTSQALAARTYAELAAVTSDLPVRPTTGHSAEADHAAAARPSSTPGRTLAKAARRSGTCMLAGFAMVGVAALALPSRPAQNSKGLESGQPDRDGRDRGRPGAHRDQSLFERCRARTQRGTRPVLGAF